MAYLFTEKGKAKVNQYTLALEAKRKEILDAGVDTADHTQIPTAEEILADINEFGLDEDGEYYNSWAVTDNYDADHPLTLVLGTDIKEESAIDTVDDIVETVNTTVEKISNPFMQMKQKFKMGISMLTGFEETD